MEWFNTLVNPSFMPHGHCYLWRPEILWTHVLSDGFIALAYYAIPVVLLVFLKKRSKIIPYPEVISLFVAFIFLCGTTHIVAIFVTWHPLYEQQGWLKAITALVSLATAIVLIPKLPSLISAPGTQEKLAITEQALNEQKHQNKKLLIVYNDAIEREERIVELKKEVNSLHAELDRPQKYLDKDFQ